MVSFIEQCVFNLLGKWRQGREHRVYKQKAVQGKGETHTNSTAPVEPVEETLCWESWNEGAEHGRKAFRAQGKGQGAKGAERGGAGGAEAEDSEATIRELQS
jgi:hypothetical protein